MSKLGAMFFREMLAKLTPHLENASAKLADFSLFERGPADPGPEERLAEYLRQREIRRKMGLPEPGIEPEDGEKGGETDEGTAIGGDADNDSGDTRDSGDSGDAAGGDGQGERSEHREPDCEPEPDDVGSPQG